MTDQRNLFIAIAVSLAILLGFQYFYELPRQELRKQQLAEQSQAQAPDRDRAGRPATVKGPDVAQAPAVPGTTPGQQATPLADASAQRSTALGASPRVPIEAPRISGSIALTGGRIDDVILNDYKVTIDDDSPPVTLLSPPGGPHAYYANFGWTAGEGVAVPDARTQWTTEASALTPQRPVTLRWDNGAGVRFERKIAIDDNYMMTVTQRVLNDSTRDLELYPYGLISRTGTPDTLGFYILHEGPLGVFNDTLKEVDYDDLKEDGPESVKSDGVWLMKSV